MGAKKSYLELILKGTKRIIQEIKDYDISERRQLITYFLKGKPYNQVMLSNIDFVRESIGIDKGKKVKFFTIYALDYRVTDNMKIKIIRVREARFSKEQYIWMNDGQEHNYLRRKLEELQKRYDMQINEYAEMKQEISETKKSLITLTFATVDTVEALSKKLFERAKEQREEMREEDEKIDFKKELEKATSETMSKLEKKMIIQEMKLIPVTINEVIEIEVSGAMFKLLSNDETRYKRKGKKSSKGEDIKRVLKKTYHYLKKNKKERMESPKEKEGSE